MREIDKKKLREINDKLWSLAVRNRDNYTCRMCGTQTKNAEAHHIIGRDNKVLRWDIDNGISLCFYCHRYKIHGGKMGEEERIEFYRKVSDYDKLKEKSTQIVKANLDFYVENFKRLYNLVKDTPEVKKIVPQYVLKELLNEEV
jgi:hypothetical protein